MGEIKTLYESKFIKLYDIQYEAGAHYYSASRRERDDLLADMPREKYETVLPDAVGCVAVLRVKGEEPKLLLNWEYRYPAGQYILSVPAGIINPEDRDREDALEATAIRELREETGLAFQEGVDDLQVIVPFVFSSPGMTDEANAMVYISINRDTMPDLTHNGSVGTEQFEGFKIITKEEAEEYLRTGRDEYGVYYPVYTWMALTYFACRVS